MVHTSPVEHLCDTTSIANYGKQAAAAAGFNTSAYTVTQPAHQIDVVNRWHKLVHNIAQAFQVMTGKKIRWLRVKHENAAGPLVLHRVRSGEQALESEVFYKAGWHFPREGCDSERRIRTVLPRR